MGRPKKDEPSARVRIPESIAKRIARISAHLGIDPDAYIASRIVGPLGEDEEQMLKDLQQEQRKKK